MATDFTKVKQKLDMPVWQATSFCYNQAQTLQAATTGGCLISDKRPSQYKQDLVWWLNGSTNLFQYRTKGNGWIPLSSPALGGTFGSGATAVFAPSQGPRGNIAAGGTTTQFALSTALSAAVGANSLVGQRIRVITDSAGLGRTEERTIVANTSGTTPTITIDTALTAAPVLNNKYEFLTGRIFMLSGGTVAAGIWKYYDVATNSFSGNLSVVNLPAAIGTTSVLVSLDALHTPITGVGGVAINGDTGGFFGQLTATAATGTTLTGQAASGDASVLANEYRNFTIRIVEDTTNPTAVGQRRRITSHTAGPSPVYTVPAWTVTPSATAKYMIENNDDIILWANLTTTTYRYDPVANTWDTSTYAVGQANAAGSFAFQPFGTELNAQKTIRHSYIYKFRGGSTNTLDIFDIAGGATGLSIANVVYDNQGLVLVGTSAAHVYNALNNVAHIAPIQVANTPANMYYFDVERNSLRSYASPPYNTNTVSDGDRMAIDFFVDGTDKKAQIYFLASGSQLMYKSLFINGD